MINNCHECDKSYLKDLFMDGAEFVDICSCDNEYIGYPEDAIEEQCRFKTVRCIRSWSECSNVARDSFGKLFGVDFIELFKLDSEYKLLSEENEVYKIFNSKNKVTEFGREFKNFFEFV